MSGRRVKPAAIAGRAMTVESAPLLRVLCVTDDAQLGLLVQETLATSLPSSVIEVEESDLVRPDTLASAVCMVLDSQLEHTAGVDALRRYRAAGFAGAAVLLLNDPPLAAATRAASLGTPLTVLKQEIPARLTSAVVAAARPLVSPGSWTLLYEELRNTQRFVALGQIASQLRHDLSNPMTVISSEAQMMDLDPELPERYRESIGEILAMCRRVKALVRELDGLVQIPLPSVESGAEKENRE